MRALKTSPVWVFGVGLLLVSCVATPAPDDARVLPLAPAYAPTTHNAQAQAQATLAAVEAGKAELANTATALANAQIALEVANAQARLTDAHAAGETATAGIERAELATQAAQATRDRAVELTLEAQALATQTTAAKQTATAWPPAATALMATSRAIARQNQQAEITSNWRGLTTGFWSLFPIALVVLLMAGLVWAYIQLLPALNLRLRTRNGAHGETLIMLDDGNKVNLLLPGRSVGPVLSATQAAADAEHQLRVATQDNAVRLARASAHGGGMGLLAPPISGAEPECAYDLIPAAAMPPPLLADPNVLPLLEARWKENSDAD